MAERDARRWLAPAVVCLAAVATGAALIVTRPDPGGAIASPQDTDGVVATDAVPGSSTTSSSTTTTSMPLTTPEPGTVLIDGVVHRSVYHCVAFPFSNPSEGIGDGHVASYVDHVVADDGSMAIVETQRFDADLGLRLDVIGGDVGSRPIGEDSLDGPVDVPMSDGSTVSVWSSLVPASNMCDMLVVQGIDDPFAFTASGLVATCRLPDGAGQLAMFDAGLLAVFGPADSGTIVPVDSGPSSLTGITVEANEASTTLRGLVTPLGVDGAATQEFEFVRFGGPDDEGNELVETDCTAAQVAAYDARVTPSEDL